MSTTLALSDPLWHELCGWLHDDHEVAGILTAHVIDDDEGTTLLAHTVQRLPESSYLERRPDGLVIRSTGWVSAVRATRTLGTMALFVHTHPGGTAQFSTHDDTVDEQLHASFIDHAGHPLYGAVVIAGDHHAPTVTGRLRRPEQTEPVPIDKIRIVGNRLQVHLPQADEPTDVTTFDRQIRAFGRDGQAVLHALTVGVVGAGGTGSPVIEQLARLGVGTLIVIDDDTVSPSTVTRGYGSTLHDLDRPKVDVVHDHIGNIGLGTTVTTHHENLRHETTAKTLRHCDIVFCCVDGHAARLILNRWAYRHLAPVIDLAVLVSSDHGRLTSIDARITWLAPGAACLLCRGRIDAVAAYAEHLDPDDRHRLAAQGYAPELADPEPSVVTLTTTIAGLACTELLHRLFATADTAATELLVRLHHRTINQNQRPPRTGCFCNDPTRWALGLTAPYLDLTWAT